ncbi:MAG TPA: CvpA family protein [Candidatus Solibacter sp.]|nr:CvpA family protein [Candidatus Solibacter sp.]
MIGWIDAIVLVYVLINAVLGFRYGVFRRVLHVAAFYVGLLLAQALSVGLAQMFSFNTGSYPSAAHFGVFLAVLFVLVVVGEVLMFGYGDALAAMNALIFDRFFGLALGIAAGVLEMAVVLYLFQYMAVTSLPSGAIRPDVVNYFSGQMSSPSARLLNQLRSGVIFLYGPVLPAEPASYFAKTYS